MPVRRNRVAPILPLVLIVVCGVGFDRVGFGRVALGDGPGPGNDGVDPGRVRHAETITLVGGVAVRVTYDPETWKPWRRPMPGERLASMSFRTHRDESTVVRVHSRRTAIDAKAFREQMAFIQLAKGAPGVFVREGTTKFDGRSWLVLEYRYPTRRPRSHETVYFTATKSGHVIVSVFADDATQRPAGQPDVDEFLRSSIALE